MPVLLSPRRTYDVVLPADADDPKALRLKCRVLACDPYLDFLDLIDKARAGAEARAIQEGLNAALAFVVTGWVNGLDFTPEAFDALLRQTLLMSEKWEYLNLILDGQKLVESDVKKSISQSPLAGAASAPIAPVVESAATAPASPSLSV